MCSYLPVLGAVQGNWVKLFGVEERMIGGEGLSMMGVWLVSGCRGKGRGVGGIKEG